MVKMRYLRHPLRTSKAAKALFAARLSMWKFAAYSERRFRGDARYDLQSVTDGFLSRIQHADDDAEILARVCASYIRAVEQQKFAPEAFRATEWWQQVQQQSLAPVMRALLTSDIEALKGMYQNFFRDPCSAGLITAPYGMSKAYFGGKIKDIHRRFYLGLVLHRFDYWMERTGGRFTLNDLAGPDIGNPFGVLFGETHIRVGAEFAHYCAHKIDTLLDSKIATVAEIGGGFGGMAYYLLRDRPGVTYLDFDVPESIALTSYYLMKAFPQLRFLLFGEHNLTKKAIDEVDVVLMPTYVLASMPPGSVDLTFSSHAMSDISSDALVEYLNHIDRVTGDCFLHIGNKRASELISSLISQGCASFDLVDARSSDWHSHKVFSAGIGSAEGIAASTILEQHYMRTKSVTR
ncbi:putative sugar O-methyltransferase [Tunturiibacter lichenicola]|uniref:putative sugar O-methyltransferase n=1 Tax=Tunturiibacter lichenicola TaxID=2051959 RepID=UPI003D9BD00A